MQTPSSSASERRNAAASLKLLHRVIYLILIAFGLVYCGWMIAYSYRLNVALFFYNGLLAVFVLLLLARHLWRNVIFHNLANTVLLLVAALCLLDAVHLLRPPAGADEAASGKRPSIVRPPPTKERAYSYEVAQGDPRKFRNWWNYVVREWEGLFKALKMPDPKRRLPFKLRPGTEMEFVNSRIKVNSLGFRDREFRRQKRGQYRIVALGESTTMGVTLDPADRPWPAVLESLIRTRTNAPRPVQVINAGIAAYTLEHGIIRLREDVLALQPDLLISYHGYNGFDFLVDSTTVLQEPLPKAEPRPSPTLGMLEFRWKLQRFRGQNFQPQPKPADLARLTDGMLESYYAKLYRELIAIARKRGIPLVLVSFNMAVNHRSHPDVIKFYRGGFPGVDFSIVANRVHNLLIAALAEQHEGVFLVDSSAGLDGVHEHYIDLVHFTQSGRDRLARNIFEGLDDFLEAEARRRGEESGG